MSPDDRAATSSGPPPADTHSTGLYRALQRADRALLRSLARYDVAGLENYPSTGPYLVAMNHLDFLDVPVVFATFPHRVAAFSAVEWADHWLIGRVARRVTEVLPVDEGRFDHRSVARALGWLRAGGVLLIAPEGRRSPSRALEAAQPGAAYLASRTGVPVVPVAAWGQEDAGAAFRHGSRPRIRVRVGQPFALPGTPNRAKGEALEGYTAMIMKALAELLPAPYRGVYS